MGERSSKWTRNHFHWEVIDTVLGGKSIIDTKDGIAGFLVESPEDISRITAAYGLNIENPIEKAEIQGHFQEAISFIKRYFLQPDNPEGLKLELPKKIQELADPQDLFLMALQRYPGQMQDSYGASLRDWSCCILKIMHTVSHIDKDVRSAYFGDIQIQIFDRYYKILHRDQEQRLFLGLSLEDTEKIPLVAFETKPKKSRDSILLKLLHKPENVAEDIFDRVGIRFVTQNKIDCLRVIETLNRHGIVIPPSIKPSRSRNTLIDLAQFKKRLDHLKNDQSFEKITKEEFLEKLAPDIVTPDLVPVNTENPHSSEFYRSIQFTCRQLIKFRHPLYKDLRELKTRAQQTQEVSGEMKKILDRMELKHIQKELRFFYPYEIQIMDEDSYEENERGRSSHREYRKAKIFTAMRRVMGALMNAGR